MIYICQTIPQVQFGYGLRMPSHTLGTVWRGGMGLPVTPEGNLVLEKRSPTSKVQNNVHCVGLILPLIFP